MKPSDYRHKAKLQGRRHFNEHNKVPLNVKFVGKSMYTDKHRGNGDVNQIKSENIKLLKMIKAKGNLRNDPSLNINGMTMNMQDYHEPSRADLA